jgi:hypothetical protein
MPVKVAETSSARLAALVRQRPVILIFVPSTVELQRFVLGGAFAELAENHDLHYVLPRGEADRMRSMAPRLEASNTSELSIPPERLAQWPQILNDDADGETTIEARLKGVEPLGDILDLFDRFRPLCCILPTSLRDPFCHDVLWACDRERVVCLVLQSGWDNPPHQLLPCSRPPFVGFLGPRSARYVRAFRGIARARTCNVGAPHYEFVKPAPGREVRRMRARMGTPEGGRLILFGGSYRPHDDISALQRLERAIATGRLPPARIVYRPHHRLAAEQTRESFLQHRWEHVIFDPSVRDGDVWEQAGLDQMRTAPMFHTVYLSQLLAAADAVIAPLSTLVIDSLTMKAPTMVIAFDDSQHGPHRSQLAYLAQRKGSRAFLWCDNTDRLEDDCAALLRPDTARTLAKARSRTLQRLVTREPGTYAQRLAGFYRVTVEPEARRLRVKRPVFKRRTISHAYGADRIARDYCGTEIAAPVVPGYWMHGWIPAYHNVDPALIALHKKTGEHDGRDVEEQIRDERENVQQWMSRVDQADYLTSHGYRHVQAIGLPITYLPKPDVQRVPGSLLVMPPHGHDTHGPGDPVADLYASVIADLRPKFEHIWVGLNEGDIVRNEWVEAFQRHGIGIFTTTDQSAPDTIVRLQRILSTFEYVTTNGFGSQIAYAAYCGAKVSVYGPYAEFPRERMRLTNGVKMFPRLLDAAHYLCTEEALRTHYPFLFVEPDKAVLRQEWAAREVGEPSRRFPEELARMFQWSPETHGRRQITARSANRRSTTPAGKNQSASRGAGDRPLVLFGMADAGFVRHFEKVITGLLEAGVDVHVCLSARHETITPDDCQLSRPARRGHVTFSLGEASLTAMPPGTERVRMLRDIVLRSRSPLAGATHLPARLSDRQRPDVLSEALRARLERMFGRAPDFLKDLADGCLSRLDERIPPPEAARRVIDRTRPDYVVVTPLVNFASREADLVKAARIRKIPTLLAVANWDDLSSRGRIQIRPDRVAVWNETMASEATTFHGVSPGRIWITGAPVLDSWFGRTSSRNRETFLRSLELHPQRPLIAYLCSAGSVASGEHRVVKAWLRTIRSQQDDARLNDANVIIRPHPTESEIWANELPADQSGIPRWRGAVVWPLRPRHPAAAAEQAELFDTLYHADAVVGISTSAMLEAAVLGKLVLTLPGYAPSDSQIGNRQSWRLAESGLLLQANDMAEHVRLLSTALERPQKVFADRDRFVADVVRPLGQQVEASASLVSLILRDMRIRPAVDVEGPQRPPVRSSAAET